MTTIIRELPWERLTFAHLGYHTLFQMVLIAVLIGFFALSHSEKTMGALVMRPGLKYRNYPFFFVAAGWMGLLWLTINRINRDHQFWLDTSFPREFVEDMMMRSVLSSTASFALYFIGGLLILKAMRHRQEIREKGMKDGTGFYPWETIEGGKWVGPGALRVYFRVPKRKALFFSTGREHPDEEPASFLWEIKPWQEPEVKLYLEKYLPGRIEG